MAMNVNNGNVRQGLNASPTSRQELRNELEKEWDKLPRGKSPQPASPKSPTKFNLDMNAVRAAQQIITQPIVMQTVSQTTVSQTTSSTTANSTTTNSTTTTTTWISPSTNSVPEKNTPREKVYEKKNNDGEENSFEKSSNSARSYRDSPRKNEAYPHLSRVRSPSATKKMAASQQNSPATTPRDENGGEENKSPRSPRGNMRDLRKIVSRKFSEIDLSGVSSSLKETASSVKEALSPSGTPRKSPTQAARFEEILASIPIVDRNRMMTEICELEKSQDFNKRSISIQTTLMHATLLKQLPEDSPFRNFEGLQFLLKDINLNLRNKNYSVDTVVNLEDPDFSFHVNEVANGNFILPWGHDSSDVDFNLRKYLNAVTKTFARDFPHSTYKVREADNSQRTITSIDEFITYVDGKANPGMAMIVSNIASQNLGNFFKNALFLRYDANKVSHSLLKLFDGTPLLPLAGAKATYVFNKDINGTIEIDYTWESVRAAESGKKIFAKNLIDGVTRLEMEDPSLKISARITIRPDGNWEIGNPHVQAEGWNQTASTD